MIFPLHMLILSAMCLYALYMAYAVRDSQPLRLVAMYTAFFLFSNLVGYLTQTYDLDYTLPAFVSFCLYMTLFRYAVGMKRQDSVTYFCVLLILAMIAQVVMLIYFTASHYFESQVQMYDKAVWAFVTFGLSISILEIFALLGVINGSGTKGYTGSNRSSFTRLDGIPTNYFTQEAIQAHDWTQGKTIEHQRPKRRR